MSKFIDSLKPSENKNDDTCQEELYEDKVTSKIDLDKENTAEYSDTVEPSYIISNDLHEKDVNEDIKPKVGKLSIADLITSIDYSESTPIFDVVEKFVNLIGNNMNEALRRCNPSTELSRQAVHTVLQLYVFYDENSEFLKFVDSSLLLRNSDVALELRDEFIQMMSEVNLLMLMVNNYACDVQDLESASILSMLPAN